MKKSKKIRPKSQDEVIHLFATGITDLKKNNVRSEGNKLYYNSMLVAIKYRKIVFIRTFSNRSSYGNGLSTNSIIWSFDKDKYTIFVANELRDNLQYNIEQSIYYELSCIEDKIANIYRVIYNDRISATHIENTTINATNYNKILDTFKYRFKRKFLSTIIPKVWGTYYEGWNCYNYSHPLNKSIRNIFNNKIFTDEEVNIYEAKRFWYVNIRGFTSYYNNLGIKTSTLKDKLFIYNDEETRNRILESTKDRLERKAKALIERNKRDIAKHYINTVKWMKGDNVASYSLYMYNVVLSAGLRIVDDNVVTSRHADVPIAHARALYKIFKNCEATNTEFVADGTSIKVGHYKVQFIKKGMCNGVEQYYLKAGCHYISSDIIHKFVEINELKW